MQNLQEKTLIAAWNEFTENGDRFSALYAARTCGYFIAQMAINGVPDHYEKHREHEDFVFTLLDAQFMFFKIAIAEAQEGK